MNLFKMDLSTYVLLLTIGTIGIAMASIGINFYNKCKKTTHKLSKGNKTFLIWMLVVFILIIVAIGLKGISNFYRFFKK